MLNAFNFLKHRPSESVFSKFNIAEFEKLLREKNEEFWRKTGEKRALKLFHIAAERVPGYKHFLKEHKINHRKIKSITDFQSVPLTSKDNYIKKYPVKALCLAGEISVNNLLAVSSGSTGAPTFWPRGSYQEFEAAVIHELIYHYLFAIDKYKTLLIVGFPMGIYVSGLATTISSLLVSEKGYQLTVAAPGTNKDDVLKIIRAARRDYQQIVLAGHPFFIKDVLETGVEGGVKWHSVKLKMMLCSEGFSEKWRDYVLCAAGLGDESLAIVSTYGSSEFLLMAHETQSSIALKRIMEDKQDGIDGVFQYNPMFRYIEEVNEELIFTAASGIPLIRYAIKDRGRTITGEQVKSEFGLGPPRWRLPFVTLAGRSDQAIVFYAANIYPEHIKGALNYPPFFKQLTGRFVMRKDYTPEMEEFLEINIELRRNIKQDLRLKNDIRHRIFEHLKKINVEYSHSVNYAPIDITPTINLKPYQDPEYFKPGLKPKYIQK